MPPRKVRKASRIPLKSAPSGVAPTDLLHFELFFAIALFGILPSVVIYRLSVVRDRAVPFLRNVALGTAFFVALAYATAHTRPWMNQNLSTVGSVSLPWSYVANTVKVAINYRMANVEQKRLPDGEFLADLPTDTKQIVVLVLGESARAANHAQYGYPRETNAFTKDLGVVALHQRGGVAGRGGLHRRLLRGGGQRAHRHRVAVRAAPASP